MSGPTENAQAIQRRIAGEQRARLARAGEDGCKVVYTFVPGNLSELFVALDLIPFYPEHVALRHAFRGGTESLLRRAEQDGMAEDVCSYVKCDLATAAHQAADADGEPVPPPDLLLLPTTGCAVLMKWFELQRDLHGAPMVMLQVPYASDGELDPEALAGLEEQLRHVVVPALERVAGRRLDVARLEQALALSAQAEDDFCAVLAAARHRPSPIDNWFEGMFHVGPLFSSARGTPACAAYYRTLRAEVEARVKAKQGPPAEAGCSPTERFRLVVEGPPSAVRFRELREVFREFGAVTVAASYARVGGLYDLGFRHDPGRPFESLARFAAGCYTNLGLPARTALLETWLRDFEADGLLVASSKSCKSFSLGQLPMMRELERRTGRPAAIIETDLIDGRYTSLANVRGRLDAFFQSIEQRRGRA